MILSPTDRPTDRLYCWSVSRSIGRSVDRSVGRSVGQSVVRSVGRLVSRSVGRSVSRSVKLASVFTIGGHKLSAAAVVSLNGQQ